MSIDAALFRPRYFFDTFAEQRARFLDGCRHARVPVQTTWHPAKGPSGEALASDVAVIGATDARKTLIVCSGTHGIEGFCGSAIQSALLRPGALAAMAPDIALVLVHALNPYGFAWLRRTNEDNIDLNRNFLDFDLPPPDNPAYDQVHRHLVPADWDGPARRHADAALERYVAERGMRELQAAVFGGQYTHPDGLVFGGKSASWSNRLWRRILGTHAAGAELVAVLDVHSGLGAPAACELISGARHGTREMNVAKAWFGAGIVFPGGTSTAPAAMGYMGNSLATALPRAVAALVVAEFGTVDFDVIFDTLRADNWIHQHDHPGSARWLSVKRTMYGAFVRAEDSWKASIVDQGLDLVLKTADALAATEAVDF